MNTGSITMIKLQCDIREDRDRVDTIHSLFKDIVTIEQTQIAVGDYVFYNDENKVLFAVEWKTYEDYVSSIKNGHLQSQLNDMDAYEHSYLIVTGTFQSFIKKAKKLGLFITKEQINGFKTSVAGRHKTKLIHYDTEKEGMLGLLKLLSIHKGDIGSEIIPERHKYTGNPNLDMFLSVRGIGTKTANELLKQYTFTQFVSECKKGNVKVSKSVKEYINKL